MTPPVPITYLSVHTYSYTCTRVLEYVYRALWVGWDSQSSQSTQSMTSPIVSDFGVSVVVVGKKEDSLVRIDYSARTVNPRTRVDNSNSRPVPVPWLKATNTEMQMSIFYLARYCIAIPVSTMPMPTPIPIHVLGVPVQLGGIAILDVHS